jgi:pSer/pThr/pTyr-binding forkhead associated (FHA) protein
VTEPRLIVEVRYGRLAGTKVALEPGRSLKVGRTERADLVLAHDQHLSGAHFELAWDGTRCSLRDLGSATGTRLGGQRVAEGDVTHGGWIQAGETDFMVYVEGKTPPGRRKLDAEARAAEERRLEAAERALASLRASAAKVPIYAVLDGARDRRILELARQHIETHQSLYEGLPGEVFDSMAPYLVGPMRKDSALLDRLFSEGHGKRWGIYCTSREKFAEVRRHFRRFLMVQLETTNQEAYFRFYDPGVFRVFWPTCSAWQRQKLAEKVQEIFVEEKDLSLSALVRDASAAATDVARRG